MKTLLATMILALAGTVPVHAAPLMEQGLTIKAPPCKTTKAKRPPLAAQKELPYASAIKADFNGDGWCDYAIGVPYPVNSQMNSYFLSELMLLGSKSGWLRPLHGKNPDIPLLGFGSAPWAWAEVDLSDIQLIYPKTGGAPYVVGLFAGGDDQEFLDVAKWSHVGCQAMLPVQWMTVYRWDGKVGAFKEVDKRNSDVVLSFYYHAIKRRCQKR